MLQKNLKAEGDDYSDYDAANENDDDDNFQTTKKL